MIVARECTRCHQMLPMDRFYVNPQGTFGRTSFCRDCYSEYNRNYYTESQNRTLEKADRRHEHWTKSELDIILDHDGELQYGNKKSYKWKYEAEKAALMVGRTVYAVHTRRSIYINDPEAGLQHVDDHPAPPRSETVCETCFMAYNGALSACPNCE